MLDATSPLRVKGYQHGIVFTEVELLRKLSVAAYLHGLGF
jgi:hypothetical protein